MISIKACVQLVAYQCVALVKSLFLVRRNKNILVTNWYWVLFMSQWSGQSWESGSSSTLPSKQITRWSKMNTCNRNQQEHGKTSLFFQLQSVLPSRERPEGSREVTRLSLSTLTLQESLQGDIWNAQFPI